MKRRIECPHTLSHPINPPSELYHIVHPVLAQYQKISLLLTSGIPDVVDPFSCKVPAVMLNCVESEAINPDILYHPLSPSQDVFSNFRVCVVDIREHQIISIPILVIHILRPAFLLSAWVGRSTRARGIFRRINDLVDGMAFGALVPIGTIEVLPMPFEATVCVSSARKVIVDPWLNLSRFRGLNPTVFTW